MREEMRDNYIFLFGLIKGRAGQGRAGQGRAGQGN